MSSGRSIIASMEWATKAMSAATKASSNNTVISVFLLASFSALSIRSLNQQKEIQALETEKESLVKGNKAMKKTIWDWKQQLFAEASAENAVVPISKIKPIYGEVSTLPLAGDDAKKGDGKAPVSKIVI